VKNGHVELQSHAPTVRSVLKVLGVKGHKSSFERKCLTNTPVRLAGSVLKCSDDYKNRVVSAQAEVVPEGFPRRTCCRMSCLVAANLGSGELAHPPYGT
jgi:hypothetical protein